MIEPFLSAVPVLMKLEEAGYEAYFVGGSVRDFLLNKQISDVDIATSATPEEVKRVFSRTVDVGIEHGTVLVIYNNESYEITTFRTEAEYLDFRRPKEVAFIRSLKEDLQRRDFTMNAIAMDRQGNLIDPFNGRLAIDEKVIQTVGSAMERFQEDALRMMRAVRFVSQLSFAMESQTITALTKLIPLLDNIAVERKRTEFEKLLAGQNRKKAISILIDTDLYSYLPGLKNQKKFLELLLAYHCEKLNIKEMWSLLLFCLELKNNDADSFLRGWRLPVKAVRDIQITLTYLAKRLEQEWTVYDLYTAGLDTIQSVEKLYLVLKGIEEKKSIYSWKKVYQELPIKERSEMNVTGNDLMQWFNKSGGPWLKETLFEIEHAILIGKVANNYQDIKEWLVECSRN
ncbi:CCA tRNA nucleotidyltransferase [Paenibacillus sp. BSR1-1]|uniref:CCA tRNA nucleotidyltransferase n=1 Tax=Paenibacillus sp. BSR1-1 TaxID=3020845 RepID=UPI0025B1B919|nr:CCA tRNA nucleotidyltransferase [Paenibacillus sp. BSR1-1]MDN3016728.1 CCA tRNA nucleotidyltransferase [Paenibacillus sp. BSR1-1]